MALPKESPLWEAIKEILRLVVLAIVPVAIQQFESKQLDPKVLVIIAAIAALRGVDKFLHVLGKINDSPALTAGLTRF